jgi:sugar (pentulose or hexulose) kinase
MKHYPGVYRSLEDANEQTVRLLRVHEPDPGNRDRLAEAYESYAALAEALAPVWPRLG